MSEAAANVTPFNPNAASGPALQKGQSPRPKSDPLTDVSRAMPFSDEAEKGVLSCFLQSPNELLNDAQVSIPVESFYHPANRMLYEVLLEFNNKSLPVDLVTLFKQNQNVIGGLLVRV